MSNHGHIDMPMPIAPPSDDSGMVMMRNSFFWGKDVIVLFSGWPNRSPAMYVLALFFVFLLAIAVEVLSISPSVKPGMTRTTAASIQTLAHALRISLGYLVMLAVMSFNVGLLLFAIAGHAIGFFLNRFRALAAASPPDTLPPKV